MHKYLLSVFYFSRDNTIRYKSERLRDEAEKLIKSRENKTVQTQQDSNQKLNNRLHDVVLFRAELEVVKYYYEKKIAFFLLNSVYYYGNHIYWFMYILIF